MKTKTLYAVIAAMLVLIILWFGGIIPKQIARAVADSYLNKQENGEGLKFSLVEYSSAHDCYFSQYKTADGKIRNIGIYYRWFPFYVYFDSNYPG